MEKKGSGHFEMIMAFTFFMGFVLFLFLSLQTTSNPSLFDSVLENMGDDFFDLTSVEFGSVFVMVDYNESWSCFVFNLPEDIFDFSYSGKGVIVTDLDGAVVDSGFNNGEVSLDSGENFFRVKVSEEFGAGGLSGCNGSYSYELGSVIERDVVSYSRLLDMANRYESDYEGLKDDLGVPDIFDFGIVVGNFDSLKMLPDEISSGVEVLARDELFEVLASDGTISNERVNFRVW